MVAPGILQVQHCFGRRSSTRDALLLDASFFHKVTPRVISSLAPVWPTSQRSQGSKKHLDIEEINTSAGILQSIA